MSRPPSAIINPKATAICMKIFLLVGIAIESPEKITIGIPKKAGIKEVIESLCEAKDTKIPNNTSKTPYKRENFEKGRLKTLYSLIFNL